MSSEQTTNKDVPGVVMRPPFIFAVFLALGIALHLTWPVTMVTTSFPLRVGLGASLALLGVVLAMSGRFQLRRARTQSSPFRPATSVVVEGPYRFSRNPMYLGMSLIYAGIAFGANSAWMLGLLIPLLIVLHYGVIVREEAYLERKFGNSYLEYRKAVRRWI